jgi:hypothetical protein
MSKQPIRSLTVCEGRQMLVRIHEMSAHQFTAESAAGETLGVFPTTGDAAQAINAGRIKFSPDAEPSRQEGGKHG